MLLLEYLVPSRTRRAVLGSLRDAPRGVTIRELAFGARVPYSSAYREIDRLKRTGLVRTDRVGRAVVCVWNKESKAGGILGKLLDRSPGGGTTRFPDEVLFSNLKRWGAPLARPVREKKPLSLEETLAHSVQLARRHPEVLDVWPIVLSKHRGERDLDALEELGRRLGVGKALGFLLALSADLEGDASLKARATRLRDRRWKKMEDFFLLKRGGRARELALERTPPLAREWHFIANLSLESLRSTYRKFIR